MVTRERRNSRCWAGWQRVVVLALCLRAGQACVPGDYSIVAYTDEPKAIGWNSGGSLSVHAKLRDTTKYTDDALAGYEVTFTAAADELQANGNTGLTVTATTDANGVATVLFVPKIVKGTGLGNIRVVASATLDTQMGTAVNKSDFTTCYVFGGSITVRSNPVWSRRMHLLHCGEGGWNKGADPNVSFQSRRNQPVADGVGPTYRWTVGNAADGTIVGPADQKVVTVQALRPTSALLLTLRYSFMGVECSSAVTSIVHEAVPRSADTLQLDPPADSLPYIVRIPDSTDTYHWVWYRTANMQAKSQEGRPIPFLKWHEEFAHVYDPLGEGHEIGDTWMADTGWLVSPDIHSDSAVNWPATDDVRWSAEQMIKLGNLPRTIWDLKIVKSGKPDVQIKGWE